MESRREWRWERREKLELMVRQVAGFLLSLLASEWEEPRSWLVGVWCQRPGKRRCDLAAALDRLRSALSGLWRASLPSPGTL